MLQQASMDAVLRRDRLIILSALTAATVLAWLYMGHMSWSIHDVPDEIHPGHMPAWGPPDVLFAFVMWTVMMVGMMLPSASPMVLTFSAIERRRGDGRTHLRTGLFVLGYLVVWTLYSGAAAVMQWAFHTAALLSPMGASTSPYLGGSLLFTAGLFQCTRLKYACLDRCRTPMGFLMAEWRSGPAGAWVMGLRHGLNCALCCWALMALLFVLGVMNLVWMVALSAFCLIEKVAPRTEWVSRITGLLLIGWGAWIVADALLPL